MEEDMVARVDRFANGNRSRIVREAVREYVTRLERLAREKRESAILRRHRGRLSRQTAALIETQAKP
jgi:metal-responsive CopG/Arc/MetJ family transcriptional regulator